MKTFYLPRDLRSELRNVWGVPFFGQEEEVVKKVKDFCKRKKFTKIITVGDYCSLSLPSDIKIFDGKVKRKKIKESLPFSLVCSNPPGTIQKEVWSVLRKAIKENKNIFVKGEEDLLVIPAVLLSQENTAVLYGLFNKGICLVEVSSQTKKRFKELLEKFSTQ